MGYLANFIVYTLAMVGVMMIALFVFKTSTSGGLKNNGKVLKVLDTLSLGARKTLYIVSAGDEKFLIAGDTDRTTLISKLNPQKTAPDKSDSDSQFSAVLSELKASPIPDRTEEKNTGIYETLLNKRFSDRRGLYGNFSQQKKTSNQVIKNFASIMRGE